MQSLRNKIKSSKPLRLLLTVAALLALVAGTVAVTMAVVAPHGDKVATVAAQPQPIHESPATRPAQSSSPTHTAPAPPAVTSASPTTALPAGVPSEKAPTGKTVSLKLGHVFEMSYPASWQNPLHANGTRNGSDGEIGLNQRHGDGGNISLRSLQTQPWKGMYGSSPAKFWRGQACAFSSTSGNVGPITYTAPNNLEVKFYKTKCDGGDTEYLWVVPGKFIVTASNGSSDGTRADLQVDPGYGTWIVGHGLLLK